MNNLVAGEATVPYNFTVFALEPQACNLPSLQLLLVRRVATLWPLARCTDYCIAEPHRRQLRLAHQKTRRKIDLLPVRLRLFSETIFDHWDTSLTPSTIEESAIVTATVYASGTIARMSPAHCPLGPLSTFALRLSMVAVENLRCTASSSSTQPKLQQLASRALESI